MKNWITNTLQPSPPTKKPKRAISFLSSLPSQSKQKQPQQEFIIQMPNSLASKILQYQFRCEEEPTPELIHSLTAQYTQAIQFYEYIGYKKHKNIYQKRMEQFLQKSTIDKYLRGESVSLAHRRNMAQQEIKQSKIKSMGQVQRIISQLDKKTQKDKQIVNKHIEAQELTLSRRMRKRGTRSVFTSKTAAEEQQIEQNSSSMVFLSQFDLSLTHDGKNS